MMMKVFSTLLTAFVLAVGVNNSYALVQLAPEAQQIAQAACVAMNPSKGFTFAVSRKCDKFSANCAQVCANLSERQAGPLKCINSLHVYPNKPAGDLHVIGYKTFRYNSCEGGCGPNYCCCSSK